VVERVRWQGKAKSDAGDAPAQTGATLWPADQIERWPIDRLVPYARNARTHTDAQVAQIAASIREWGWTMPVLADEDGTILAGHARVLAAHKLRLADVPVIVARGWSEAKKRAHVIADNKLALNAAWDEELLRIAACWALTTQN
jgi:ParB-like chromosome segregation protein Spo0J